ncbi:MAG: ABC transporter permease [Limnochordia bacterium]|jgi:peptide/nickel transport system permease protein|nr:ABC transporter permease [Bacillota bacterium]HOB08262.1 ABC transporter permease [Limnochordia bacterium]NLH30567.1 ABC transporter permease [Bacillota bacterium]HPT92546.1 ABC transporter permease [Limnochordia bacterium]HPZ30503.1 ABC transporter permease [Limnochordia bacterium]
MLTYIARRLLFLPVVLIGVTLLIFLAMSFLTPAQLVSAYIKSPEELKNQSIQELVAKYGLDQPVWKRYFSWMRNVLKGDLGYSVSANMYVSEAIARRFPATLELALFAVIPVVMGGIWLGTVSAKHHNRPLDHASRIFAIVGWSLPDFVFGLIILLVFYGLLRWFPPGRLSVWADNVILSGNFVQYTGMNTIDALFNGRFDIFLDALRHLVAPTITLAYLWWAYILRITRSSMLDIFGKDYVRTARAKGLMEKLVVKRHVRRNALIPVATVVGSMILGLLGGVVIVETVFDYKGIGLLIAKGAERMDYTLILGTSLFYGVLLVVTNLIVDILYAVIDPRVRLE